VVIFDVEGRMAEVEAHEKARAQEGESWVI
jgi:hypothetical protein